MFIKPIQMIQKIDSQKRAWIDSYNKLQDLFNRFSNLDASLIF